MRPPRGKLLWAALLLVSVGLSARLDAWGQVSFTQVWPEKIRYLQGEEATFLIRVQNAGPATWAGRITGVIETELDRTVPVFTEEVTLAAGEERALDQRWPVDLGEFGHALVVRARNPDGTLAAQGREVFCVGPWYYNMGRYLTAFGLGKFQSAEEVLARYGQNWRSWYVTCHELFSTAPGLWAQMTPTTETWFSGQNSFYESLQGERSFIEAAHRQGMAVMVYSIIGAYAAPAEEWSRAHPECLSYNERARPQGAFNLAELEVWRKMTPADRVSGLTPVQLTPNAADPAVQDFHLQDLIACSKLLGFDGIRWDGPPLLPGFNVRGERTDYDLDAQNAAWYARMRATLTAALPGYTVNYNFSPQKREERSGRLPKTYAALGPNAYILWESMRKAFKDPDSPLNVWEGFIEGVRGEINEYARPHGNFQHFGWYNSPSRVHQNHTQAIYYALGGHWDTGGPLRYDAFSMRFGAYLWDPALRNLPDGSRRVQVSDPQERLWWKQFVQEKPRQGGGHLIVTHVLNRPVKDRQDEFEKQAPPVQRSIAVTLTPPEGERVTRAFVLNPDAERDEWCREAELLREGGTGTVVIPRVEFWSFLVWETAP